LFHKIALNPLQNFFARNNLAHVDSMKSSATEPFFQLPVLSCVALFVFNNFWFKHAYPGVVTGKLSDLCAAFFMPLFLAALFAQLFPACGARRFTYGTGITVLAFLLMKSTASGASALNFMVEFLTGWSGFRFAQNIADPSDLLALPFSLLAWFYSQDATRTSTSHEITTHS
jgi:hypothetical protein